MSKSSEFRSELIDKVTDYQSLLIDTMVKEDGKLPDGEVMDVIHMLLPMVRGVVDKHYKPKEKRSA